MGSNDVDKNRSPEILRREILPPKKGAINVIIVKHDNMLI
jgi:hypothetical protein